MKEHSKFFLNSLDDTENFAKKGEIGLLEGAQVVSKAIGMYSKQREYVKFENDKKNGSGELIFPDKSKYKGLFKNGLFNGYGEFQLANGDKYEGYFKDGKYDGLGRYIFKNGKIKEGVWKDNGFLHKNRL